MSEITDNPPSPGDAPEEEALNIYVGPTSHRYGLTHLKIYRGEYPVHVKEALDSHPAFRLLFQPLQNYPDLRAGLGAAGDNHPVAHAVAHLTSEGVL